MLLLFFISIALNSWAQNKTGLVEKITNPAAGISKDFLFIQSNDSIEPAKLKQQSSIVRQLADNCFIIKAADSAAFPYSYKRAVNNYWKMSPVLIESNDNSAGRTASPKEYYLLTTSPEEFRQWLATNQPTIKILRSVPVKNVVIIKATKQELLERIITSPFIIFAEQAGRTVKEEQAVENFDYTLNRINKVPYLFPGIDGSGQTISVKEDLFNVHDIDFKGRYLPVEKASEKISEHATIMATIIGGAGNSSFTGTGVAKGASLSSSSFKNLLADTFYNSRQITVQNHSYGTAIENYYGVEAASYDNSTYEQPALLHVFSSGNNGASAPEAGTYKGLVGFANLTGAFKMSKNSIVVSAVDSFSGSIDYISAGPAYDGRLKPELAAFTNGGSSGSAAIVSGGALLLQQLYKQQHGQVPAAALVKAILINSADDAGAKGIDFKTGYGTVNLARALELTGQQKIFSGNLQNNQTKTFTIAIPANVQELKVTLCWTDPPAAVNSSTALVNDLDLAVAHSGEQHWLPWVLNSFPHMDSLLQPAIRKKDVINNTEQVSIELPAAGGYTITVTGNQVATPQDFYIAWQYQVKDTFYWDYPLATDNVKPAETNILRWYNSFPATGQLQWSANGLQWETIQADLSKNYALWAVPDTITTAQLRMQIGTEIFLSDTFTISKPLTAQLDFNCLDTMRFSWNKQNSATGYRLYKLGNKFWEPLLTVQDTARGFLLADLTASHYSVAALIIGKPGVKSPAMQLLTSGAGCYISNFTVANAGATAQLSLNLSTTYGIKKLLIEKNVRGEFVPLKEFNSITTLLDFTDVAVWNGGNTYRVKLVLKNEQLLFSEIKTIFFLEENNYWVYPNPAVTRQSITIVSRGTSPAIVKIFSMEGKLLLQQNIQAAFSPVSLPGWPAGIYLLSIFKNNTRQYTGKLVIQ